jgi:predicted enzyme related to lactoylglutathione lyase
MDDHPNPLARHGGLSYLEIVTPAPDKAAAFYAALLGWKIEHRGADDYRFSDGEGLLIGRFVVGRVASGGPGLLPFLYVADLDTAIERATVAGGELVTAPFAEGDVRVARIRDPGGNLLGIWQFGQRSP